MNSEIKRPVTPHPKAHNSTSNPTTTTSNPTDQTDTTLPSPKVYILLSHLQPFTPKTPLKTKIKHFLKPRLHYNRHPVNTRFSEVVEVFSAKEAAYKRLRALVKEYGGGDTIGLELMRDPSGKVCGTGYEYYSRDGLRTWWVGEAEARIEMEDLNRTAREMAGV